MEGSENGVLAMLVILAVLTASGSSYQILEGPQNATVLRGSEARFNCTVSPGWKLIMWALKGTVVLSVTPREPIITNDRFTSASYDLDGNFVSEMIIHNVQPSDSGLVRCSLQNSDLAGYAFLSVEVMGTLHILNDSLVVIEDELCNVTCQASGWIPPPDITWEVGVPVSHSSYSSFLEPGDLPRAVSVLALTPQGNGTLTCVAELRSLQASKSATVALTVVQPPPDSIDKPGASLPTWAIVLLAVSLSLLLILIIVLIIIFCCCCVSGKEKKESSYQSEIRKSANMKTNTGALETKPKSGNENYAYSSDEPRSAHSTPSPPKSSELSVPAQRGSSPPQQEPERHRPTQASRPQVSFNIASPPKVRNVTLV
ncbi:PREDICTED: immunoglobulin superfamily member 5 isoform X1 [Chinchilla lanigera]|uniref:Immunoglobulin superfamily member 5 n=1 Tax=Chinchilla lanigera TaxID=34839 RepID=A0A8C2V3S1_CHILA|nr:PREDICTED: immunoglobulin superfamily member 5 isoform X1 [Chinchilla lanigera]XP_005375833.1 PREDICTED: immunoglobulin superfamily member 5 isoform X1 [Chinchilla lanigera]XP_005375834.1 PREDICTED: immunoglobulin superfamily member 5 isoform X1 [Chinchilla lanigera]